MLDNAAARRGALALWDVVSWALAAGLVIGVRHDFALSEVLWESVVWYWLLASVLLVALGYATKFYRGRYLVGSYDEVFGLGFHIAAVGAATIVISLLLSSPPPRSVVVLTPALAVLFSASGRFVYRALLGLAPGSVIVSALLGVALSTPEAVRAEVEKLLARRAETQPLHVPSFGSVFKNPPGEHAGRLIEAAGLKGHRVGGAAFSTLHANFIANLGGASAADVLALIEIAREAVRTNTGIHLETEVRIVGEPA